MRLADLGTEVRDGVLVARLEGELDLSNIREIRSSVLREMGNDLLGLVVDLSGVRYLDSAGIQVIYELREHLAARGQELRLVVPQDALIMKTLELVDAVSVVGIVGTAEAALGAFSRNDLLSHE
jgi:anti-anti-sigma factor